MLALSCKRDCDNGIPINDACNLDSLTVTDPTSPDLEVFLTRTGFSEYANAIKEVPAGSIEWKANAFISNRSEYALEILNYRDTTDWKVEGLYGYQCESIVIPKINPFQKGKQEVFDQTAWVVDSTSMWGFYARSLDGGDISDGLWDIDTSFENYVEIRKFDKGKDYTEGRFDLHFKIRTQSTIPGVLYAENVHFRCGNFKAYVKE